MPHDTMNSTQARMPGRPKPVPPRAEPCEPVCKPTCPACGGLECLCRPRFFPGQMLTDEDLNRLERYVVEKNKLHNRYLHGWGVACGLEVICDACTPGRVVVRTGYALSPCGDDIVVCDDQSIDVCDLIDQCRPAREPACDPPYTQPARECSGGVEHWVLAICYDERPSRGVTPLTGSTDSACCSACACGGSGSCGCGSSGSGARANGGSGSCGCGSAVAKPAAGKQPKGYQAQCEATQICEGHRFTAYRYVPPSKDIKGGYITPGGHYGSTAQDLIFAWMYANRASFGALLERVLCCVSRALELRATWREGKPTDTTAALATYDDYLDALRQFAADFALHRCAFADKIEQQAKELAGPIDALRGRTSLNANHQKVIATSLLQLDYTWMELVGECFCSALLPACPAPISSNCVPLAVVAVRKSDCHVLEICNWEERKVLITWNTVGYWLSWLPWHRLRESIARLCCAPGRQQSVLWSLILLIGVIAASSAKSKSAAATAAPTGATILPEAMAAAPGAARVDAFDAAGDETLNGALASENLLLHLAGSYDRLRTGRSPEAPAWASLLARFSDLSALGPLAGEAATAQMETSHFATTLGIDALQARVAELERTTADYKTALDGLKAFFTARPPRKGG